MNHSSIRQIHLNGCVGDSLSGGEHSIRIFSLAFASLLRLLLFPLFCQEAPAWSKSKIKAGATGMRPLKGGRNLRANWKAISDLRKKRKGGLWGCSEKLQGICFWRSTQGWDEERWRCRFPENRWSCRVTWKKYRIFRILTFFTMYFFYPVQFGVLIVLSFSL